MHKPVVFLDIDEVLSIARPYACLDLAEGFARGVLPTQQQVSGVFSPVARNALAVVHRRAGGVKYVISSSWRTHFTRDQMALLFELAGYYFVADNLHEGDAWRCPPPGGGRDRETEILEWLGAHHRGEPFAVVDDRHSSGRLLLNFPDSVLSGRVVICTPGIGLTMEHVDYLVAALERPV